MQIGAHRAGVAVNYVAGDGLAHGFNKISLNKLSSLGLFGEEVHLNFGKIGTLVPTERHVEPAAGIVATEAVVTMFVHVEKEGRFEAGVFGSV